MADTNEYKTKIRIAADTKEAEAGVSAVAGRMKALGVNLLSAQKAAAMFMRVFSRLSWIAASFQLVVGWFQKLHEWMNRAATAAREFAKELQRERIASAAEAAAEAYKKLNKELQEANRLEKERNAILDQRKATARDLEDANSERSKQLEIAKLDPASATYAEDKAAIERKYARRGSVVAAARAEEDSREGAKRLYVEAEAKDREADILKKKYEDEWSRYWESSGRTSFAKQRAARGEEGALERYKAAKQQSDKDFETAEKTREAMEALRKEADSIRARAAEMTGGGRAAQIKNEANQARIDNEERADKAKREQAAREQAAREAEEKRREAEREAKRLDAEKRREAGVRATALERQIASYESGVAAVAPSGNRLSAMGLGSGSGVVKVYDQMAKSLQDLVKNSKEQLAELKAIKDAPETAVYAD